MLTDYTTYYILGVILIALEVKLGGVGLFFAGLGAITTAAITQFQLFGFEPSALNNILVFLVATSIWTAALWKPFKKLTLIKKGEGFNDIIGTNAIIASEPSLKKGVEGNVKWSGALMRAQISEISEHSEIAVGESVKIIDKLDGLLIVDKN